MDLKILAIKQGTRRQRGRAVRALDFYSGGPDLFSLVPSSNPPDQACKIFSWLASYHLGFLKPCYVPFELFVSFSLKSLIRGEDN